MKKLSAQTNFIFQFPVMIWVIRHLNLNYRLFNNLYNPSTLSVFSRDMMEWWGRDSCLTVFLVLLLKEFELTYRLRTGQHGPLLIIVVGQISSDGISEKLTIFIFHDH